MKKKIVTLMLAMGLCIPCSMALSGCGETANNGENNNVPEYVSVMGASISVPETSAYYQYWDAVNNRFNFPKNFQWEFTTADFEVTLNMSNNTTEIVDPNAYEIYQGGFYSTYENYNEYNVDFMYDGIIRATITVRVDTSRDELPMIAGITQVGNTDTYTLNAELRYTGQPQNVLNYLRVTDEDISLQDLINDGKITLAGDGEIQTEPNRINSNTGDYYSYYLCIAAGDGYAWKIDGREVMNLNVNWTIKKQILATPEILTEKVDGKYELNFQHVYNIGIGFVRGVEQHLEYDLKGNEAHLGNIPVGTNCIDYDYERNVFDVKHYPATIEIKYSENDLYTFMDENGNEVSSVFDDITWTIKPMSIGINEFAISDVNNYDNVTGTYRYKYTGNQIMPNINITDSLISRIITKGSWATDYNSEPYHMSLTFNSDTYAVLDDVTGDEILYLLNYVWANGEPIQCGVTRFNTQSYDHTVYDLEFYIDKADTALPTRVIINAQEQEETETLPTSVVLPSVRYRDYCLHVGGNFYPDASDWQDYYTAWDSDIRDYFDSFGMFTTGHFKWSNEAKEVDLLASDIPHNLKLLWWATYDEYNYNPIEIDASITVNKTTIIMPGVYSICPSYDTNPEYMSPEFSYSDGLSGTLGVSYWGYSADAPSKYIMNQLSFDSNNGGWVDVQWAYDIYYNADNYSTNVADKIDAINLNVNGLAGLGYYTIVAKIVKNNNYIYMTNDAEPVPVSEYTFRFHVVETEIDPSHGYGYYFNDFVSYGIKRGDGSLDSYYNINDARAITYDIAGLTEQYNDYNICNFFEGNFDTQNITLTNYRWNNSAWEMINTDSPIAEGRYKTIIKVTWNSANIDTNYIFAYTDRVVNGDNVEYYFEKEWNIYPSTYQIFTTGENQNIEWTGGDKIYHSDINPNYPQLSVPEGLYVDYPLYDVPTRSGYYNWSVSVKLNIYLTGYNNVIIDVDGVRKVENGYYIIDNNNQCELTNNDFYGRFLYVNKNYQYVRQLDLTRNYSLSKEYDGTPIVFDINNNGDNIVPVLNHGDINVEWWMEDPLNSYNYILMSSNPIVPGRYKLVVNVAATDTLPADMLALGVNITTAFSEINKTYDEYPVENPFAGYNNGDNVSFVWKQYVNGQGWVVVEPPTDPGTYMLCIMVSTDRYDDPYTLCVKSYYVHVYKQTPTYVITSEHTIYNGNIDVPFTNAPINITVEAYHNFGAVPVITYHAPDDPTCSQDPYETPPLEAGRGCWVRIYIPATAYSNELISIRSVCIKELPTYEMNFNTLLYGSSSEGYRIPYDGSRVNLTITQNGIGAITITYYDMEDTTTPLDFPPSALGNYLVKVEIAECDAYMPVTLTFVLRIQLEPVVTINNATLDGNGNCTTTVSAMPLSISVNVGSQYLTVEYYSSDGNTKLDEAPNTAGMYRLIIRVEGTDTTVPYSAFYNLIIYNS